MSSWFSFLLDWVRGHVVLTLLLTIATVIGSLALAIGFIVRLPIDYFQLASHSEESPSRPSLRWVLVRIGRNMLGALLVFVGIVLSLPGVPGQGILTLLVGLTLLDFPGKKRLERKIVARPRVLRTLNRLRARFGRPPLVL